MKHNIKLKLKKVSIIKLVIYHVLIVSGAITSEVPDAQVIFNLVPKEHAMADIYC